MATWICPACGRDTLHMRAEGVRASEEGIPNPNFSETFIWCGPCWIQRRKQHKELKVMKKYRKLKRIRRFIKWLSAL